MNGLNSAQCLKSIAIIIVCITFALFSRNASTQTFVGSQTCSVCHNSDGRYDGWAASLHANLYKAPIPANFIAPWSGDVRIEDAGRGLALVAELNNNGGGGPFTVRLYLDDAKTMPLIPGDPVLTVIRTHGGHPVPKNANDGSFSRGNVAGESQYIGKQRYHVNINGDEFILPLQWNPVPDLDGNSGGWVEYNLRNWMNASGAFLIGPNNSEERNCAGCHRTGINTVTFDGANFNLNGNPTVEDNIGCEACHGPGSAHVAGGFAGPPGNRQIVQPALLTQQQQVELCGFCHSRGVSVGQVNSTSLSYPYRDDVVPGTPRPGDAWSDYYIEGGGYWPDGVTASQHHQQYEEFLASHHYTDGSLTCTSCHDPHGTAFEHDLIKPARGMANGTLCYDCHQSALFPNDNDADRMAHTRHRVSPVTPDCTNCHMPAAVTSAVRYDIHSHTFNVLTAADTLTSAMPNSCAILCHRGDGNDPPGDLDIDIHTWNSPSDLAIANWLINPSVDWFFGDGDSRNGFQTYLLVVNPNATLAANLELTLLFEDREPLVLNQTVNPNARFTFRLHDELVSASIPPSGFAIHLQSTNGIKVYAERAMYWPVNGVNRGAGTNTIGASSLGVDWFLAEGTTTGGRETLILVGNPRDAQAELEITYLREGQPPVMVSAALPARRRLMIAASNDAPNSNFSTRIRSTNLVPIVVDRTMYGSADGQSQKWGHAALGVRDTNDQWLLAEGAVHSNFETFLLLANPNDGEVVSQLRFLLANGAQVTKTENIPANSRKTINVELSYAEMLDQAGFSSEVSVQSGGGIVVERAMFFTGSGFTQRSLAHNAVGLTEPRTRWSMPEGAVGGGSQFESFILIGNPNATDSNVTVTFIREDSTTVEVPVTVGAGQRVTVKANDYLDASAGTVSFSTIVESTNAVGVITERAMYWTANGTPRYEGHVSGGIPAP